MRGKADGVCSPRPLMDTMPLVYRGDFLAEQLCTSFDDVLAPIFATLDCLPAYLDPKTAPADMLDWLAGWIGLTVGGHAQAARKRELIIAGAALLPWRGTVRSVREAVVAAFNRETEVIESGSATWSDKPNSRPAGQPVPSLIVRVTVDKDDDVDQRSLDALVESVKPAHLPHRVEVVVRAAPVGAVSGGDDGETSNIPAGDGDQTLVIPIGEREAPSAVDGGDGDKPSGSGDL
jgi:phage tail-like protein